MRSSNKVNSILSKKTSEGFCDTTNIRKASIAVALFSIRLKNKSTNSSGEGISSGEGFFFFKYWQEGR